MVEGADGFDDVFAEFVDLECQGEEVEVEEGANVFFLLGVAEGFGVEPADEELEGEVVGFGEAVGFGGDGVRVVGFVVEAGAEEGGVVAEELFVEGPTGVFCADVDVYEGGGQESGGGEFSEWRI